MTPDPIPKCRYEKPPEWQLSLLCLRERHTSPKLRSVIEIVVERFDSETTTQSAWTT